MKMSFNTIEGEVFEVTSDVYEVLLNLSKKGYHTLHAYTEDKIVCEDYVYVDDHNRIIYVMINLPDSIGMWPDGFEILKTHDYKNGWGRYNICYNMSVLRCKYSDHLAWLQDGDGVDYPILPYELWKEEHEIALSNFRKWVSDLPDMKGGVNQRGLKSSLFFFAIIFFSKKNGEQ